MDVDTVVRWVAWVACEKCLARHHEACWKEAGRCGGCGHDVALAGRLRTAQRVERPRTLFALWALLAVGFLSVATIVIGGLVVYSNQRSHAALAAAQAEQARVREQAQAEQARAREQAQAELALEREHARRLFDNQTQATRAAVDLAEDRVGGPRRVEVADGFAVVDEHGSWIFVETTPDGARLVVAGIGTTFLEAEGDEVTCTSPGSLSRVLAKRSSPRDILMVVEGDEPTSRFAVAPAQRDAIVAALAAPPGEVDIAALLAKHGFVQKPR